MRIFPRHLRRIEAGTANVTVATLVAAATAFDVALAAVFERDQVGETKPSAAGRSALRRR